MDGFADEAGAAGTCVAVRTTCVSAAETAEVVNVPVARNCAVIACEPLAAYAGEVQVACPLGFVACEVQLALIAWPPSKKLIVPVAVLGLTAAVYCTVVAVNEGLSEVEGVGTLVVVVTLCVRAPLTDEDAYVPEPTNCAVMVCVPLVA